MFGFFVFNTIRRVTSELVAAKVADRLMRLPRNRVTHLVTDPASLWLYNETRYHNCLDCCDFIIDDSRPEVCNECTKLRLDEERFWRELLDDDDWCARLEDELREEYDYDEH